MEREHNTGNRSRKALGFTLFIPAYALSILLVHLAPTTPCFCSLIVQTMVSATTCLPVQGTVETQSINDNEQVGHITMTSSRPVAFRQAFGQFNITGGIKGAITGTTPTGEVILEHHIGFPGVGSIISYNDIATFTGQPDSQGNIPVTETAPITTTAYSGEFAGWTGQLSSNRNSEFYDRSKRF